MSAPQIRLEARGLFSFRWFVTLDGRTLRSGGPTVGRSAAMRQARAAQASEERRLTAHTSPTRSATGGHTP